MRGGGEHLVEAFVHFLVGDVPFDVRLLQALHGGVAVLFAER